MKNGMGNAKTLFSLFFIRFWDNVMQVSIDTVGGIWGKTCSVLFKTIGPNYETVFYQPACVEQIRRYYT